MTSEHRTQLERAGLALVGVLLLVVGFSAGRCSAGPGPVEVQERQVEKLVYLDLKTEDLIRGMTFAKEVRKTIYRDVVTSTTDAGTTVVDKSIEHYGATEASTATETSKLTEVSTGQRETETTKVTLARPSWRAGLLVGATWKEPALVIYGPLVLGAAFDVRLAKTPCFVGGWGTTQGTLGVSGSCEF